MANLKIETEKDHLEKSKDGFTLFTSIPVLTGCNIDLKMRYVPLRGDSNGISQEISALNQALCDLSLDSTVNKESVPELTISKITKRDFSDAAKDSIKQLEEKGILVSIEQVEV